MYLKTLANPANLFRVLAVLIVGLVAIGVFITIDATGGIASKSNDASAKAELAQLSAEGSDQLRAMAQITQQRIDAVLVPEWAGLTAAQQEDLTAWLAGDTQEPPPDRLANLPAPFSMSEAIQFQAARDYLATRTDQLLAAGANAVERALANQMRTESDNTTDLYIREPTLGHLRDLHLTLGVLLSFTSDQTPALASEAVNLRDGLASGILVLRWANVVLAILGGLTVLAVAFLMSKTTQRLLREARREQEELAGLTRDLEYRNNQLSALYNVFNEITDTLSLRYVVRATIFESLRIMVADMVVLRILRGDDLEVVGAMTSEGKEIQDLPPVKLGSGPSGRTAKRGRTLRINESGEEMMAPPDAESDERAPSRQAGLDARLESGLIVPLIVGARVVGTISCWSQKVAAFSEADERVLEMMASQVATAIVAADTTDKSERRAHQDPLTSLPNRRQLDEDMQGELAALAESGRHAVIAMVDIDHFKRFNDEYGHKVGDVTLQKIASVLRSSARDQDHVYRYGGEEFLVVFTDSEAVDALNLANRLRLAVEATPISGEQLDPIGPVTISVGLSLLPEHGQDLGELIGLADHAMYQAKLNGRNRVELWDDETPALVSEAA